MLGAAGLVHGGHHPRPAAAGRRPEVSRWPDAAQEAGPAARAAQHAWAAVAGNPMFRPLACDRARARPARAADAVRRGHAADPRPRPRPRVHADRRSSSATSIADLEPDEWAWVVRALRAAPGLRPPRRRPATRVDAELAVARCAGRSPGSWRSCGSAGQPMHLPASCPPATGGALADGGGARASPTGRPAVRRRAPPATPTVTDVAAVRTALAAAGRPGGRPMAGRAGSRRASARPRSTAAGEAGRSTRGHGTGRSPTRRGSLARRLVRVVVPAAGRRSPPSSPSSPTSTVARAWRHLRRRRRPGRGGDLRQPVRPPSRERVAVRASRTRCCTPRCATATASADRDPYLWNVRRRLRHQRLAGRDGRRRPARRRALRPAADRAVGRGGLRPDRHRPAPAAAARARCAGAASATSWASRCRAGGPAGIELDEYYRRALATGLALPRDAGPRAGCRPGWSRRSGRWTTRRCPGTRSWPAGSRSTFRAPEPRRLVRPPVPAAVGHAGHPPARAGGGRIEDGRARPPSASCWTRPDRWTAMLLGKALGAIACYARPATCRAPGSCSATPPPTTRATCRAEHRRAGCGCAGAAARCSSRASTCWSGPTTFPPTPRSWSSPTATATSCGSGASTPSWCPEGARLPFTPRGPVFRSADHAVRGLASAVSYVDARLRRTRRRLEPRRSHPIQHRYRARPARPRRLAQAGPRTRHAPVRAEFPGLGLDDQLGKLQPEAALELGRRQLRTAAAGDQGLDLLLDAELAQARRALVEVVLITTGGRRRTPGRGRGIPRSRTSPQSVSCGSPQLIDSHLASASSGRLGAA